MKWLVLLVITTLPVLFAAASSRALYDPDTIRVKYVSDQVAELGEILEEYRYKVGHYPDGLTCLKPLVGSNIRRLPQDPWGRPYFYRIDGGKPDIFSLGQDGALGGSEMDFDYAYSTPEANAEHYRAAVRSDNIRHFTPYALAWLYLTIVGACFVLRK